MFGSSQDCCTHRISHNLDPRFGFSLQQGCPCPRQRAALTGLLPTPAEDVPPGAFCLGFGIAAMAQSSSKTHRLSLLLPRGTMRA